MSDALIHNEAEQEFSRPNKFPAVIELTDINRRDELENDVAVTNPFIIQDEIVGSAEPARSVIPAQILPQPDAVQNPEEFLRALDEALAAVRNIASDEELEQQVTKAGPVQPRHGQQNSAITKLEDTAVQAASSGKPAMEIPDAFQKQARRSSRFGLFAILTGVASLVLAGFLALYLLKYPLSLPIFGQTPVDIQTEPVGAQSRIEEPVDLQPIQVASVVIRANPTLSINPIEGISGAPISLGMEIEPVAGLGASLAISGLPEGAGLSSGIETSRGAWLVDANAVPELTMFTPIGATGSYDIRVQLIGQDGKIVDSKLLPVRLTPATLNAPIPATQSTATIHPKDQSRMASEQTVVTEESSDPTVADLMEKVTNGNQASVTTSSGSMPVSPITSMDPSVIVDQADTLLARGDIETARTLYEEAANAGNAEAALKAGMTYDPLYLNAESATAGNEGNAEPGTSLVWYARAIGLGSRAAEPRRDALNSFIATN